MAGEKVLTPGHRTFGPRRNRRLTKDRVRKLIKEGGRGRHPDGDGLSLRIDGGSAIWCLTYRFKGQRREMSLSSAFSVGLEDARQAAEDAHRLIRRDERDPQAHRAARAAGRASERTFLQTAELLVQKLAKDGRDAKTVKQASAWLLGVLPGGKKADTNYCAPIHRTMLRDIGGADVVDLLTPLWHAKPETASRLRARIGQVIAFGQVAGFAGAENRDRPNPARWKGNLEFVFAQRSEFAPVESFDSMPHKQLPAFMGRLQASGGVAARALDLLIHTSVRSGDIRGARVGEFDLAARLWSVPAARLKTRRTRNGEPLNVPLTDSAIAIVAPFLEGKAPGDLVFPGLRGKALSDMTLGAVMKRLKVAGATVHGFRSSFSSWRADDGRFEPEVAEAALGHKVPGVAGIYQRGELLDRRRELMTAWSAYLDVDSVNNVLVMSR
jgi:integrase